MVALALPSAWLLAVPFFGSGQTTPAKGGKTEFAADQAPDSNAGKPAIAFSRKRALDYVDAISSIGPRVSGTEGMRRQQDLIQKHFEDLGARVVFQPFTAKQKSRPEPVSMANIIVSWHPERDKRVMLCARYDTRPVPDQETGSPKARVKVPASRDGAAGIAMLMEMGNHMKDLKTKIGVDFVFLDGEDYVFDKRQELGDRYFLGSEHFAAAWRKSKSRPNYLAAVEVDMVSGADARFLKEGHSWLRSRLLVQEIWSLADELHSSAFQNRVGERIRAGHLVLASAGIPAIAIMEKNGPGGRRKVNTTADYVSADYVPETTAQVAEVLTAWLQRK
jgi:hypothetical protein